MNTRGVILLKKTSPFCDVFKNTLLFTRHKYRVFFLVFKVFIHEFLKDSPCDRFVIYIKRQLFTPKHFGVEMFYNLSFDYQILNRAKFLRLNNIFCIIVEALKIIPYNCDK
jgi:hypothetical protein